MGKITKKTSESACPSLIVTMIDDSFRLPQKGKVKNKIGMEGVYSIKTKSF